ncbi:MAG: YggS family pyridoxal phosphate-dependent enzyme [Nanoarchaeota archaeon]
MSIKLSNDNEKGLEKSKNFLKDNLKEIKKSIPNDVNLVAATKTRSIKEIEEVIDSGIKIIGENYIQEAEEKYQKLRGRVKFHCIGHLQTNKVKQAIKIFDMIETVDSLRLAKEIDKRSKAIDKVMPILIEINSGKEPNKDGMMPEQAIYIIKEISKLPNIQIKGLMTMAPFSDDPEDLRPYFKLTKQLFDKIKKQNIPNVDMDLLSMGMSDSYKISIEEGSNMVRIGTKIFGKRKK